MFGSCYKLLEYLILCLELVHLVLLQPLKVSDFYDFVGAFWKFAQEVVDALAVPSLFLFLIAELIETIDAPPNL